MASSERTDTNANATTVSQFEVGGGGCKPSFFARSLASLR
jgi:hypothetical protein